MASARPAGSPSDAQEQLSYWSASPSSPIHVLHTAPHAIIAFLGTCSFAGFTVALIQQKLLDAILTALLIGLFLHTYTLHSERCRLKCKIPAGGLAGVSVFPDKPRAKDSPVTAGVAGRSVARCREDEAPELDLNGHAKMLGVSLRSGVAQRENSTLNQILMDALAKEYLRCVSSLKCYQTAFGPLPEDSPEPVPERVATPSRSDALSSTFKQLRIPSDLEALGQGESRFHTPRSPAGIESPDPKRCRATPEPQRSEGLEETPMPAAPTNTPATVARANGSDSLFPADGTLQESNSSSDDTTSEPACLSDDAKPQEEEAQPSFFGLFARQSI